MQESPQIVGAVAAGGVAPAPGMPPHERNVIRARLNLSHSASPEMTAV
jgi:hypothetical protein